ncbi:MAG: hydantoinase B/oxoprolinase family protein, partial [Mesorhizobium sp.]
VTINGNRLSVDFAGSSKPVKDGINTPLPFTKASVYTALRSVMKSEIPNCRGFERAIVVAAPLGTAAIPCIPRPAARAELPATELSMRCSGHSRLRCPIASPPTGWADRASRPSVAGITASPYVFTETVMGTWGAGQSHDGQVGVPHMGATRRMCRSR